MRNILILILSLTFSMMEAQELVRIPVIGIVQDLENDSLLCNSGYQYLVESISKVISPRSVSERQFKENLKKIKQLKINLYAFNLFMPGDLKLVGPSINEDSVLAYSQRVFQRCKEADVKMIIWGSGGARRISDGFDPVKAKNQFVTIARKVSILAKKYKITLALENLNSTETNFINTVAEALAIVRTVDHPNFRLCADIYHMLKEAEGADIIEKAGGYLVHCDIAEKENRNPPGELGQDFRPYLIALKKIKYAGKIIIESRWTTLAEQSKPAYSYLQKQIDEVYKTK